MKTIAYLGLLVFGAATTAIAMALFLVIPSRSSAVDAFVEFGKDPNDGVTEEGLIDPLIVARGDVVTEVLREVNHRDMPKRRYALIFLGNSRRRDALPTLKRIIDDAGEELVFRGDALRALAMIDANEGKRHAEAFVLRSDYLGDAAREIQGGRLLPYRSYGTALSTYLCVRLTGC